MSPSSIGIVSNSPIESMTSPKPFLRWAGGKRALLSTLRSHMPEDFSRYHEPFLGAGSLFFSLPIDMPKYVSDFNSELIATYEAIRDELPKVLIELSKFDSAKSTYLAVRAWDREPNFGSRSSASRAARFIYLNKCGFNGLYRLNKQGFYNVPFGGKENVDFIAEANLIRVSSFLRGKDKQGVLTTKTSTGDYTDFLKQIKGKGDFVYLDPPYHPVSATAGFVDYNENGFTAGNQEELHELIVELTRSNVLVLLSNSNTDFIKDLYSENLFTQIEIPVRRAIAAKTTSRGVTSELLISNFGVQK